MPFHWKDIPANVEAQKKQQKTKERMKERERESNKVTWTQVGDAFFTCLHSWCAFSAQNRNKKKIEKQKKNTKKNVKRKTKKKKKKKKEEAKTSHFMVCVCVCVCVCIHWLALGQSKRVSGLCFFFFCWSLFFFYLVRRIYWLWSLVSLSFQVLHCVIFVFFGASLPFCCTGYTHSSCPKPAVT